MDAYIEKGHTAKFIQNDISCHIIEAQRFSLKTARAGLELFCIVFPVICIGLLILSLLVSSGCLWVQGLAAMGYKKTTAEAQQLFIEMDVDNSGGLDFGEFLQVCAILPHSSRCARGTRVDDSISPEDDSNLG